MTPAKLLEILYRHYTLLFDAGFKPECAAEDPHGALKALPHVMWMCKELKDNNGFGDPEKAARWLGFIQGVLWARGLATIEEMRKLNK